ncbi:hypothetical protein TanjilG_04161 [Lupinus angustifolius]|uniref:Glycosyltransferase 2-like domain-containing protein n=1 Tax=Lupinus angustifolius TaxID=3871 RepID=A0A4P1RK01_LUPAN|nr:hypothetical protein TanjilG_04161 [Lupinus angustifolius]
MAPPSSVLVATEKTNNDFTLLQVHDSDSQMFLEKKQKATNPKQFRWFLLLKLHKVLTCLSWLTTGFKATFVLVKKRISLSNTSDEDPKYRGKLYRIIKIFLALSIGALVIEIIAHFKKWNLHNMMMIQPFEVQGLLQWSYMAWLSFREDYVAPFVLLVSKFCIVLFLIQSLDRLVLCLGCFWIKFKKLKPSIEADAYDVEDPSTFPMVLVQIPMCNEIEVYAQSIGAASQLDWPKDRILIQVLDDSDDSNLQNLINDEVSAWKEKGVNIIYRHRLIRTGYKAGNLKSAMSCDYVKDYEFVTIFDADFQPNPDFLKLTVPHFKGKPDLGLVQARWSFVNKDENLLTRLQNINLCFHFEVEQQVNGHFLNFFGFNGTAGVWRIKALEESGGWLERTTVEDMDIAVRAHLNGWKFIYLNDVKVLCELPESYEAYKKQQHRWHSGPMQLFRLCLPAILTSKFKKLKPSIEADAYDVEDPSTFPMVLVQIPMCNEIEVYAQSIGAASQLDWPKDRILIQVLDDSDDSNLQNLINDEVSAWKEKGVNIIYRHRLIRTGYKAGNLKSAMSCDYVKDYEFVTIFDADFQPNPDFLKLTVPHFKGKPDLGLVQARWSFVNKDENLLTRLQNINLCFHFEVEQQVNGHFLNFFGFNGTAGVWRIKALEESGGWLERTTVEDMDIAVRAHLNGWKFIYLNDVKVLCELPESYEAYKKQQHRWHSGPMQLFRLCLPAILTSKISTWKKANLIFLFFLLRKLILPFYSFTLFCVILPFTMFIPESELPLWVICYIPIVMSFLNILPSPKSVPFLVPYLLFENTMSVTKFNAMVSGLFQLGSAYEWVVTKKTGRSSESDLLAYAERESKSSNEDKILRRHSESGLELLCKLKEAKKPQKKRNKLYRKELALAFLLLTASARSLLSEHGLHFYFLLFQGLSFLVMGLDLIGEQVS